MERNTQILVMAASVAYGSVLLLGIMLAGGPLTSAVAAAALALCWAQTTVMCVVNDMESNWVGVSYLMALAASTAALAMYLAEKLF